MISAVINRLINNLDITNLVGRNIADDRFKIYPVIVPQEETPPAIVVRKAAEAPEYCQRELSRNEILIEIKVIDKDYELLDTLEALIMTDLERLKGTFAGVNVEDIFKVNSFDGYEDEFEEFIRIITLKMVI